MLGIFPPTTHFINGMGSAQTEPSLYYPTLHPPRPVSLLYSTDPSFMSLSRFKT